MDDFDATLKDLLDGIPPGDVVGSDDPAAAIFILGVVLIVALTLLFT